MNCRAASMASQRTTSRTISRNGYTATSMAASIALLNSFSGSGRMLASFWVAVISGGSSLVPALAAIRPSNHFVGLHNAQRLTCACQTNHAGHPVAAPRRCTGARAGTCDPLRTVRDDLPRDARARRRPGLPGSDPLVDPTSAGRALRRHRNSPMNRARAAPLHRRREHSPRCAGRPAHGDGPYRDGVRRRARARSLIFHSRVKRP